MRDMYGDYSYDGGYYYDDSHHYYDEDYEDDPHYRALYMKPNPGDVDALLQIVERVANIGERYAVNLPVFYTPISTWENEDIPF